MKNLKRLKCLILMMALLSSVLSPIYGAKDLEGKHPIGIQLNEIVRTHFDHIATAINETIKNGPTEKTLHRFSESDKVVYKELMGYLKKANTVVSAQEKKLVLTHDHGKVELELVDLLSNTYMANGQLFHLNPDKSFEENLQSAVTLMSKGMVKGERKSVMNTLFDLTTGLVMEEAHAFVFLAVPIWALIAGGTIAVATDTIVSSSVSDIKNGISPEVRQKITELQDKFEERAEFCESDMGRLYAGDRSVIESNSSVKMVAELIEGLDAELEDTWFDGDGKEQIDYDSLGCEAYDNERDKISSKQVIGIVPGSWHGKIVAPLCRAQERLNECFKKIEDILRDEDIAISDVKKGSFKSVTPYEGLLEEYQELSGVRSR